MKSKIDTIQIHTDINNIKDISLINKDNKPYIVKARQVDDRIFIAIHGSRSNNRYNYSIETYTYTYFIDHLKWIYEDLGIIDVSKVELDRVDYCFDYDNKFDDMYKLNNALSVLYGIEVKADLKDMIEINKLIDQQKTSISIRNKGKTKQLYIYDKHIESEGRHPYTTRQEFRLMRMKGKSIEQAIQITYLMLDNLYNNFYEAEQLKINNLYRLYLDELDQGKVHSFSSFITRYNEQIITRNICEQLYVLTGHKGKFKNWIKEYRKKNRLEFIKRSDIKKTIIEMKKSIKLYMGSNTTLFLR